ncbi:hypothetical protein HZA45_02545, partial [Candidatus Peregrinibacteria bacterium]|nr:hypothetical protein [Candidatus Peregrinibacteria bacterium]
MSLRWHSQAEEKREETEMTCDDFLALPDRFGDFALTNAVRLKPDSDSNSQLVPVEGYAIDDDAEGSVDDQNV